MRIVQSVFGEDDGARKTVRLRSLRTVFKREVVREGVPEYVATCRFTSPAQIYEMFCDLEHEAKEHFIALHLDGKNRVVCFDRISVGSLNQSIVHPREVFKAALMSSAAALIMIHNHPTGDPSPSRDDIEITRRLAEVGKLIGIPVTDHIIIGASFHSFVEHGLL